MMSNARDPFSGLPGNETPESVIEQNEAMHRKAQEDAMNTARLFFEVFDTGRGRELLALLRDCTIELPLIRMTGTFGGGEISMTGAEWAYFREGQNSVVRMIEAQMQIAVTPTTDNGENENG